MTDSPFNIAVYGIHAGDWAGAVVPHPCVFYDGEAHPDRIPNAGIITPGVLSSALPVTLAGKYIACISASERDDDPNLMRSFHPPVSLIAIIGFLTQPLPAPVYSSGDYVFYPDRRELVCGDDIVQLTEIERDILTIVSHSSCSAEALALALWGRADEHTLQSLRSAISRLRQKCADTELLKADNQHHDYVF